MLWSGFEISRTHSCLGIPAIIYDAVSLMMGLLQKERQMVVVRVREGIETNL